MEVLWKDLQLFILWRTGQGMNHIEVFYTYSWKSENSQRMKKFLGTFILNHERKLVAWKGIFYLCGMCQSLQNLRWN